MRARGYIALHTELPQRNHGRSFTVEGEHLFQGNVPFRLLISVELRPTPDGLRLVQHTRIHTPGPLSWLIAWLYAGPAKQIQQGQLERLKRRAEEVLAPAHDDA